MFLREDRIVVVTQHVRNIETLTNQPNAQLQRGLGGRESEVQSDETSKAKKMADIERAVAGEAAGPVKEKKDRLVAWGNEQASGKDFNLMCAAVMDISTVKVVLALANSCGVPGQARRYLERVRKG